MAAQPKNKRSCQHQRFIPDINITSWLTKIDGLTRETLTYQHQDLCQLPLATLQAPLICGSHTNAAPHADWARWEGVWLWPLLEASVPRPAASFVAIYGADGYATTFPLAQLKGALLALKQGGAFIPPERGGPVRLVVPGRYGYKQPKWVRHILLTDTPTRGDLEQHGWSVEGQLPPLATARATHITARYGEAVQLQGHTNATAVHIAIDGGNWNPCMVDEAAQTWQATWLPPAPGHYQLTVQAQDGTQPQPHHTRPMITVEVR